MSNSWFKVQGNVSEYYIQGDENGYDTLSGIIHTFWKDNQAIHAKYGSEAAFYRKVLEVNHLSEHSGSACGTLVDGIVTLHPNHWLNLVEAGVMPERPPLYHNKSCKIPTRVSLGAPAPEPELVAPAVSPADEKLPEFTPTYAPLAREVVAGGAGQGDGNWTEEQFLQVPLLFGQKLDKPHTAARGKNDHTIRLQTYAEGLRSFVDATYVPATALATAALSGGTVTGSPLKVDAQHDRTDKDHEGAEGGPRKDGFFSSQWPFIHTLNPFGTSQYEKQASTNLPGFYPVDPATGEVLSPDSKFFFAPGTNRDFMLADGIARVTTKPGNKYHWASAGSPQDIRANNYDASSNMNDWSIVPQLNAAKTAYETAQKSGDKTAMHDAAQHVVDLLNYQSTLVFIKAEPMRHAQTFQARDSFIALAQKDGVDGLDANHMMEGSPLQTVTKDQLRSYLRDDYYTKMAKDTPDKFEFTYRHVVPEKDQVKDLSKPEDLKKAIAQYVEQMPMMKTLPETGMAYPDGFISTRDPQHPTDVRFDNLNPFEKGTLYPQEIPADRMAAMTKALQLIGSNTEATKALMRSAGNDRYIAEALIDMDQRSLNEPRDVSTDQKIKWDLETNVAAVASHGYSDKTLKEVFHITRDKDGKPHYDKTPAVGADGNTFASVDPKLIANAAQEVAASADNPKIVAMRQQQLKDMNKYGGDSPLFPTGALQTRLMYGIATNKGNEAYTAIAAALKDVPNSEEILKQGMYAAADVGQAQRVGEPYSAQKAYTEAQDAILNKGNGLHVVNGAAVISGRDNKHIFDSLSAIGAQEAPSKHLVAALAAASDTNPAVAVKILTSAAGLDAPYRVSVAKAALGSTAPATTAALLSDAADKAKFAALNPANLSADDASFVLNKLAANPLTAKAALQSIALQAPASRSVVNATLASNPELGEAAINTLSPEARQALIDQEHVNKESFVTSHDAKVAGVANPELMRKIGEQASAVGQANVLLSEQKTQSRALYAVTNESLKENPRFMVSAIATTAAANPTIAANLGKALVDVGAQRDKGLLNRFLHTDDVLHYDSTAKLGHMLVDLSVAKGKYDLSVKQGKPDAKAAKDLARLTGDLNTFVTDINPKTEEGRHHLQALSDLNSLMLSGTAPDTKVQLAAGVVTAQHVALATTISTAIQSAVGGQPNVLATQLGSSEQIIDVAKNLPEAVVTAPPADTAAMAAVSNKLAASLATDYAKWQGIPLFLLPLGGGSSTPDQPTQVIPPVNCPTCKIPGGSGAVLPGG